MFKWIAGLIDRLFALIGAVLFLQAPQFIMQYQHQLQGRVDELNWQLRLLRETAKLTGKSFDQYIYKFLQSNDSDFVHQGQFLQKVVDRSNLLSQNLQTLQETSIWMKPFVFLTNLDLDIAQSTASHFKAGLSLTAESLVYALAGLVVGFSIFQIIKKILNMMFRNKYILSVRNKLVF